MCGFMLFVNIGNPTFKAITMHYHHGTLPVNDRFGSRELTFRSLTGGQAPTLFLISGIGATCWGARPQFLLERCQEHQRNYVAFTPSDMNESINCGTIFDFNLKRQFLDCAAILANISSERVVIAASSFGANAALDMARLKPGRVAALCLVAPATDMDEHILNPAFRRVPELPNILQQQGYLDYPLPTGHQGKKSAIRLGLGAINEARGVMQELMRHTSIPCPLTILHDPNDRQVPIEASRHLLRQLKSKHPARLIEVEGAAHTHNRPTNHDILWQQAQNLLALAS